MFFFFPLQLIWVHLKKNHLLLVFWFFLFSFVTQSMATKFGIPILFLYPEYLGKVDFISHLILGLGCGGYIMAYNIASYIINGFRFPFLATLSRPFFKYTINNSILPLTFVAVYIFQLIDFQLYAELVPGEKVAVHLVGFLLGNTIFVLLSFGYFLAFNKNAEGLGIPKRKKAAKKTVESPVKGGFHRKEKWYRIFRLPREWRVDTYLANPFRIALARKSEHYTRDMLQQVFAQNHINASMFEISIILLVLAFGFFRENPIFLIPAGASIFLFFTMVLMIFSALHSWLKGWSTLIFIGLALSVNYFSQYPALHYFNYAYGLDYQSGQVEYSVERLQALNLDRDQQAADKTRGIEILENWKAQNPSQTAFTTTKPKLLILSTSGGGLRSAMWTFVVLQEADSMTDGALFQHMHLMTGSSGGLVGASFMRELQLQAQLGNNINPRAQRYAEQISSDILNPIALTLTVNDLFLRFQRFEDNNNSYTKDRGYAFEQQLNKNTDWLLDKRMADYTEPEYKAQTPLLLISPAISNDGRRIHLSSQPVSYLSALPEKNAEFFLPANESVDFNRLFHGLDPDQLKFTTALRMNATFPYVMPHVNLPTRPGIELMDAGARDNLGMLNILQYMHTFRDWISENTSGVVVLQIRDQPKEQTEISEEGRTLSESITNPLGNLYKNWLTIQDYQEDHMIKYVPEWLDAPFEVVDIQLGHNPERPISLSWHLTQKEKEKIKNSVQTLETRKALRRLNTLLQ